MQITVICDIEWNGVEPHRVIIDTDPKGVKLPQDVIDTIKEEVQTNLELNAPAVGGSLLEVGTTAMEGN